MDKMVFHSPVFGPIQSRRLGSSLGINLMPPARKVCNFNCIYCECGWNLPTLPDKEGLSTLLPLPQEVAQALEHNLRHLEQEGNLPDAITFSGNGEPTLHPEFRRIVGQTVSIRDQFSPGTKVCVFSNAGTLHKPGVFEGLRMADLRIMKIDSAYENTLNLINKPGLGYSLCRTIGQLKRFGGDFTLQTLFFSGYIEGKRVNNTTEEELAAWVALVDELKPRQVMVYTLDRMTPAPDLIKCPLDKLQAIAAIIREKGYEVIVAG
jgi:wyosine [tRNA(Phe)-imidazoG37] synthetase (radical SAM superfamily)